MYLSVIHMVYLKSHKEPLILAVPDLLVGPGCWNRTFRAAIVFLYMYVPHG